jgi:hypothetical protein
MKSIIVLEKVEGTNFVKSLSVANVAVSAVVCMVYKYNFIIDKSNVA